ncbi:HAD family hydrolase [Granulosicoccaceae sp. 1_MG-2023]|nr:HAD family hydrolase [Granulosicoccaceae sp. 1_MG-2023]
MALALFDLDHTLVSTDTPTLWFDFLIERELLDPAQIRPQIARFTADYNAGTLDYADYIRFELQNLAGFEMNELLALRETFRCERLRGYISQKARDLLQKHREQGDTLVIITATNAFIAEAAAHELGVPHLLATEGQITGQSFTGEPLGILCFREGKIAKLQEWLDGREENLDGSYFYSDSRNDIPLLEAATHPVAVNPDETLAALAAQRGWPVLDLAVRSAAE